jgi:hypothetical protein
MKIAVALFTLSALLGVAPQPRNAQNVAMQQPTALSASDRKEVVRRLLSILRTTDPASSAGLYEAQQQGMALAFAAFAFGTPQEQDSILSAAVEQVEALPTADDLLDRSPVSRVISEVEGLSPIFTKARQRVGRLSFEVDRVALPRGPARARRVFPIVDGGKVNVMSEVEMQYAYLLSTILRLATERPLPATHPLMARRRDLSRRLFSFLVRDKIGFYWLEAPAWHWSGPFSNMRERLQLKLAASDARITTPKWFGAIVDHELHLIAVASDLSAAARHDSALDAMLTKTESAMLQEIRATALDMLHRRVSVGPHGSGFLVDLGYWSTNPSYAFAGCLEKTPVPTTPCPLDTVATDVSHARRWPWWLESMKEAWPPDARARLEIEGYQRRLAFQFGQVVLYHDRRRRPLTRNYMDGIDGWYSLADAPSKRWGYSPSSMTGALRYGSWARLSPLQPDIGPAHGEFCRVLASTAPDDILFRTRYYGSASDKRELGGLGESDLYGGGSLYALTCRIGSAFGYY